MTENNRRRIELLEQMAQAIYREWFVHFHYPGHESDELVDSPIGLNPSGREVKTLGSVVELRYGKALKDADRAGGPVAVVGSSGVVGWHDSALVTGPAIVVGRKGNVGKIIWLSGDCYPIDTTYFVVTDFPLRFVYRQLRTLEFVNSHAAVPGLNRDQAYGLPFLLPTRELLSLFEQKAESISELETSLQQDVTTLTSLRDMLLQNL